MNDGDGHYTWRDDKGVVMTGPFDDETAKARRIARLAQGSAAADPQRIAEILGGQSASRLAKVSSGLDVDAIRRATEGIDVALYQPTIHTPRINRIAEGAERAQRQYAQQIQAAHDKLYGQGLLGAVQPYQPGITAKALELSERVQRELIGARVRNPAGGILSGIDFAELQRSMRWANVFDQQAASLGRIFGTTNFDGLGELTRAAQSIVEATSGLREKLIDDFAGIAPRSDLLDATALKMSMLSGSIDVLSATSAVARAAETTLLGEWNMGVGLPASYWRDNAARQRIYRDAEVDPGLIDAENAEVVGVLIDSGLVEGTRTRRGTAVAIFNVGPLRIEVSASHPTAGAYRAIDAFEVAMRAFISAKLEAADGPNWFKHRVPGAILLMAKEKRKAAMLAGEPNVPLINFLDLGQLIDIVTNGRNWPLFEPVFLEQDSFRVEMRRINAHRRAPAHSRRMDGARLLDLAVAIGRLQRAMINNGGWSVGWDDDQ